MLARVKTCALLGIDAYPVEVEVDVDRGLLCFSTVGFPGATPRPRRSRCSTDVMRFLLVLVAD